jgi:hypothetical protein
LWKRIGGRFADQGCQICVVYDVIRPLIENASLKSSGRIYMGYAFGCKLHLGPGNLLLRFHFMLTDKNQDMP